MGASGCQSYPTRVTQKWCKGLWQQKPHTYGSGRCGRNVSQLSVQGERASELIPITDPWLKEISVYLLGFFDEKQNYFYILKYSNAHSKPSSIICLLWDLGKILNPSKSHSFICEMRIIILESDSIEWENECQALGRVPGT